MMRFSKITALVLALMMLMAMATGALAAKQQKTVTITSSDLGVTGELQNLKYTSPEGLVLEADLARKDGDETLLVSMLNKGADQYDISFTAPSGWKIISMSCNDGAEVHRETAGDDYRSGYNENTDAYEWYPVNPEGESVLKFHGSLSTYAKMTALATDFTIVIAGDAPDSGDVPSTGDTTNIALLGILMLAGVSGMFLALRRRG